MAEETIAPDPAPVAAEVVPVPGEAQSPEAVAAVEAAPSPEVPGAVNSPAASGTSEVEAPAPVEAEAPKPEPSAIEGEPEQQAAPAEAPAEVVAPSYEPFTFPEGIKGDDEQMSSFNALAGKHTLTQEAAQEFVDLHTASMQQYSEQYREYLEQHQRDTFAQTRKAWAKEIDTTFGNERDTVVNQAKSAIALAFPKIEDREALWSMMAYTGAGDHPLMIRLLSTLDQRLSERAAPATPLPHAPKQNAADARYGNRA